MCWEPGCYVSACFSLEKWKDFRKNIDFWVTQGVKGVFLNGGREIPESDYERCLSDCAEYIDKKISFLCGTGFSFLKEAIKYVRKMQDAGCDGVVLYTKPLTAEVIYRSPKYYQDIARNSPFLKIIIYNTFHRNNYLLSAEELKTLDWETPNICGVIPQIEDAKKIKDVCRPDFAVFSENDELAVEDFYHHKVEGIFSNIANFAPHAMEKLYCCIYTKRLNEALEINNALRPLFNVMNIKQEIVSGGKIIDEFSSPSESSSIIMRGIGMPAPITHANQATVKRIRNAIKEVLIDNKWVFEPVERFYGTNIEKRVLNDSLWESFVDKNNAKATY